MGITLRRLRKEDKQIVLDLIQSRIDSGTRVALSDQGINQDWVDTVMKKDMTYEYTHRVFGLFEDDVLEMIFDVRMRDDYYVVGMFVSSAEAGRKTKLVNGYNPKSTMILEYVLAEMEKEGFTRFYSMIPDHPKWRRAEKNPNRTTKDKYNIEEVLKIPAGTLPRDIPNLDFDLAAVTTRPFNIDMIVRKMTLKESHAVA